MGYDAVVFDADGVLCTLSSRQTLHAAIRRALAEHGVTDPSDDVCDRLLGVTEAELHALCDRHGIADPGAFWRSRDRHAIAVQRAAIRSGEKGLYPDVAAIVDLPVPRAVVSNNQQATVEFLLEHTGLADLFDPVFGRAPTLDGVRKKKPSPHYLERAVEALGAERPLFVGDSNVDLAAAEAAGIDAAFVGRDHRVGYALEHEPTHVLDSLAELEGLVGDGAPVASDD